MGCSLGALLTAGCLPFPPACNCHGHADDCYYDPEVDRHNASQNQDSVYQGGGVCIACQVGGAPSGTRGWAGPGAAGRDTLDSVALLYPQHHTTGINCERCLPGFYRDPDQPLDSPHTCRREWGQPGWGVLGTGGWEQGSPGSPAPCLPGPSHRSGRPATALLPLPTLRRDCPSGARVLGLGLMTPGPHPGCNCESNFTDGTCEDLTGRCHCRPSFSGERCEACAAGLTGFPHCYCEGAAGGRAGEPLVLPPPPCAEPTWLTCVSPPQLCPPPATPPWHRCSRPDRL